MIEVTRGRPKVVGIDPDYPGLLQVHVYLDPAPDSAWARIFASPNGYGRPLSMHEPALYHDRVELRPPDSELDAYIEKLDERIQLANAQYAREVVPGLEAAERARREALERDRRRIEDAQRRLDEPDDAA